MHLKLVHVFLICVVFPQFRTDSSCSKMPYAKMPNFLKCQNVNVSKFNLKCSAIQKVVSLLELYMSSFSKMSSFSNSYTKNGALKKKAQTHST